MANAASLSGKLSQMANGAVYSDDLTVMQIHDMFLPLRQVSLLLHLVISVTTTLETVEFVLSQSLRNSLPETVWLVLLLRNVWMVS